MLSRLSSKCTPCRTGWLDTQESNLASHSPEVTAPELDVLSGVARLCSTTSRTSPSMSLPDAAAFSRNLASVSDEKLMCRVMGGLSELGKCSFQVYRSPRFWGLVCHLGPGDVPITSACACGY